MGKDETVYVVIGIWGGCFESIQAFRHESDAVTKSQQLVKKFGIDPEHPEQSEHSVIRTEISVD